MNSISMYITGVPVQKLAETFDTYAKMNRRPMASLVKKQAMELANTLFTVTPRADPEAIALKVKSLGWRVMRRRGTWKKIQRAVKKARGIKGRKKLTAPVTLAEFQAFMIERRVKRIGAIASGWVPAMIGLGSRMRVPRGSNNKSKGHVKIVLQGPKPYVLLANSVPGADVVQNKHKFVEEAITLRIADMEVYIRRKLLEESVVVPFQAMPTVTNRRVA